jgi:hypothetical protein
MNESLIASLKSAYREHPEALFSFFTISGHVISGKISQFDEVITLQTGTECTMVPIVRLEAFSYHDKP